jgi:type II secretory pathway pseudopilin PulG
MKKTIATLTIIGLLTIIAGVGVMNRRDRQARERAEAQAAMQVAQEIQREQQAREETEKARILAETDAIVKSVEEQQKSAQRAKKVNECVRRAEGKPLVDGDCLKNALQNGAGIQKCTDEAEQKRKEEVRACRVK